MPSLKSINPYSGEINAVYETYSDETLREKIEIAHTAFQNWRTTSFAQRKELFYKLAEVIEADLEN